MNQQPLLDDFSMKEFLSRKVNEMTDIFTISFQIFFQNSNYKFLAIFYAIFSSLENGGKENCSQNCGK